jgi:hypothetical protein
LLSIQALLGTPNPDDPLTIEIGKRWKNDKAAAIKTAKEWTKLYGTPRPCDRADTKPLTMMAQERCNTPHGLDQEFHAGEINRDDLKNPVSELLSPIATSKKPVGHVAHPTPLRCEGDFQYTQLRGIDEIRLLRLQPGSSGDPIVGIIDHAILPSYDCTTHLEIRLPGCAVCKNMPRITPYEALSYVWGNPATTQTISLYNPHSKLNLSLSITLNCAQALKQLRLSDEERFIWVDAICINQADIAERSAQVRLMHRIYRAASQVLIYLGESSADSDKAISILEDDANGDRPWITDNLDPGEITAVRNLLYRPWFHRVWVLQEVAWSRSALVLCGSRITPWRETFHKAYSSSIGYIDDLQPLPYVMSFGEWRLADTFLTPEALLHELRNARDCASTDAEDKIYALLALFQRRPDDQRLAIDYSRQLPGLFTDIAAYLLEKIGTSVLSETYGCGKIPGLPSWVPDWTIPSQKRPYCFHGCFAGGRRSGRIEFMPSLCEKSERLMKIRAVLLGRVETICVTFHDSIDGGLTTLLQWISRENYRSIKQLVEYIALVESGSYPDYDSLLWLVGLEGNIDSEAFSRRWAREGKSMKQVLSKLRNRAFFIASGGRLGLAPHNAQRHDEIFVLEGGQMCYMLRRTGKEYRFVGDCFLLGYMQDTLKYDTDGICVQANGIPVPWKEITVA